MGGTEMQRYHLFGELMTVLEVLESTAPEGKVQVSGDAMKAAQHDVLAQQRGLCAGIHFVKREGDCLMTSKGDEYSFDRCGGRTFLAERRSSIISNTMTVPVQRLEVRSEGRWHRRYTNDAA